MTGTEPVQVHLKSLARAGLTPVFVRSTSPLDGLVTREKQESWMFSGIIESFGLGQAARAFAGSITYEIDTGFADLILGESIAVNGVCLTVVTFDKLGRAEFYASPETLQRSNLGALRLGDLANLERRCLCRPAVQVISFKVMSTGWKRLFRFSPKLGLSKST